MKIRMIVDRIGYAPAGTEIEVDENRAARWCGSMKLAEFVERKDAKAVALKEEARKKAAAAEAKRILKRQQKIDKGEGIED